MLETVYVPTSVQNIFLLNTDSVDFGVAARLNIRDRRIEHADVNDSVILSCTLLSGQQCKAQIQAQE
jgi:hypothetical protein